MRGYYRGRYRDNNMYSVQAEYRIPVYWRFGLDIFAGFGDVGPNIIFDLKTTKPSYGVGLRFSVDKKEKINIRFDYARGKDSQAFYISFGEAF